MYFKGQKYPKKQKTKNLVTHCYRASASSSTVIFFFFFKIYKNISFPSVLISAAVALLPYAIPYKLIPFGDGLRDPPIYNDLLQKITTNVSQYDLGVFSIFG
jgi:hypothetical protein